MIRDGAVWGFPVLRILRYSLAHGGVRVGDFKPASRKRDFNLAQQLWAASMDTRLGGMATLVDVCYPCLIISIELMPAPEAAAE